MGKMMALRGILLLIVAFDGVVSQFQPHLEILPMQSIQRKPVGKSLMLTCRPNVPDVNLVSDLQWKDDQNMTVLPKPIEYYRPLYDSSGNRLPVKPGQQPPPMYTEVLPGDQSLALLIPVLTDTMAGTYYCTASYANTELMVQSVRIETYVAITWKDAPENQYPILGSDYVVKCEVTARPAPSIDWLRNGDPIKTGDRYVVRTHGLLIRSVEEADDGIYTCRAAVIQTGELVERSIRVEVQIKPQIYGLPSVLETVEGQGFSTFCNATGKPVPEFTWVKSIDQRNVAQADRFIVNSITGQMNILTVDKDDYGYYTCIAKNAAGVSQSQTLLDVVIRPRIYELWNTTVAVKVEGQLLCKATGRPPPLITFRRWGSKEELVPGPQPNDDRIVLEQSFDDERGESSGTMRILDVNRTDDGLYECVARNKGESAFKVGHIAVEYPPTFDYMKTLPPVFSWEERPVNLSCLAEGIPNATIEWRLNERLITELYDRNFEIQGSGPRSDLIVTPVDNRYYTAYKCIASNRLGRSEHIMQLKLARIPDAIPQAIPRIVTATSITFDIIAPPVELGMPITAFSVQYIRELDRDWNNAFNRTWSPDSPYIVEGLFPQTTYNFRFAARNLVGLGQWSAYKLQSTPRRSEPEPPRLLHNPIDDSEAEDGADPMVMSPYADHFEMRWSVPPNNGELIDFYQLRYCPGVKVNGEWHETGELCVTRDIHASEATAYDMSSLQAGTYYRTELRAHNAIGFSEPASLMIKTARGGDVVLRKDDPILSSVAIIAIAVGGVLLLLIIMDLLCCKICNIGLLATIRQSGNKSSPSRDIDDDNKFSSFFIIFNRDDDQENQPLNNVAANGGVKFIPSSVDYDGTMTYSRSGELIGRNSAV
ncbi:fasciclin-2 isoform X3 [Phlebotomus argentipes]|uniref:fasciclin-2 isoform X3 n=1 Tax=Phlebotomus argentipes TaxID=94469 RepID=UPI00289335D9|nr:fasciclin-2 isoform X3 [Phlebotomus argentipes]